MFCLLVLQSQENHMAQRIIQYPLGNHLPFGSMGPSEGFRRPGVLPFDLMMAGPDSLEQSIAGSLQPGIRENLSPVLHSLAPFIFLATELVILGNLFS